MEFARRFQKHFGVREGVHLHVDRALPRHAGLGSGTQLALAVARAMAEVSGISAEVSELACAVGRTKRSAIGTWTFAGGGLVLEGGRRREGDGVAPLLARIPFPPSWRCVVAVPAADAGISGAEEAEAFAQLPPVLLSEVERVAHLVLMGLLPAKGDIRYETEDYSGLLTEERVRKGICLVPERRELFTEMTVADNLILGAYTRWRDRAAVERDLEDVARCLAASARCWRLGAR